MLIQSNPVLLEKQQICYKAFQDMINNRELIQNLMNRIIQNLMMIEDPDDKSNSIHFFRLNLP